MNKIVGKAELETTSVLLAAFLGQALTRQVEEDSISYPKRFFFLSAISMWTPTVKLTRAASRKPGRYPSEDETEIPSKTGPINAPIPMLVSRIPKIVPYWSTP